MTPKFGICNTRQRTASVRLDVRHLGVVLVLTSHEIRGDAPDTPHGFCSVFDIEKIEPTRSMKLRRAPTRIRWFVLGKCAFGEVLDVKRVYTQLQHTNVMIQGRHHKDLCLLTKLPVRRCVSAYIIPLNVAISPNRLVYDLWIPEG